MEYKFERQIETPEETINAYLARLDIIWDFYKKDGKLDSFSPDEVNILSRLTRFEVASVASLDSSLTTEVTGIDKKTEEERMKDWSKGQKNAVAIRMNYLSDLVLGWKLVPWKDAQEKLVQSGLKLKIVTRDPDPRFERKADPHEVKGGSSTLGRLGGTNPITWEDDSGRR